MLRRTRSCRPAGGTWGLADVKGTNQGQVSLTEKLHRDDEAKATRPQGLVAPAGKTAPPDPALDHQDANAADRLATVSLNNAAVGHAPSAKDQAEVMEMFREVNDDHADGKKPAAKSNGVGKPPSAKDRAEAMEDFREVNGDVGRGAPPGAKDRAEVMDMFREVNGGPGQPAPDTKARAAALAPELDGGIAAKKTVGVPSAKDRAEVMQD